MLVTGGSSGIGAGLAEAFAERGATVGVVARREDRLGEVLERCRVHSPDSRMWVVDLADPAAVDRLSVDVDGDVRGLRERSGCPEAVTGDDRGDSRSFVHVAQNETAAGCVSTCR